MITENSGKCKKKKTPEKPAKSGFSGVFSFFSQQPCGLAVFIEFADFFARWADIEQTFSRYGTRIWCCTAGKRTDISIHFVFFRLLLTNNHFRKGR